MVMGIYAEMRANSSGVGSRAQAAHGGGDEDLSEVGTTLIETSGRLRRGVLPILEADLRAWSN